MLQHSNTATQQRRDACQVVRCPAVHTRRKPLVVFPCSPARRLQQHAADGTDVRQRQQAGTPQRGDGLCAEVSARTALGAPRQSGLRPACHLAGALLRGVGVRTRMALGEPGTCRPSERSQPSHPTCVQGTLLNIHPLTLAVGAAWKRVRQQVGHVCMLIATLSH